MDLTNKRKVLLAIDEMYCNSPNSTLRETMYCFMADIGDDTYLTKPFLDISIIKRQMNAIYKKYPYICSMENFDIIMEYWDAVEIMRKLAPPERDFKFEEFN